MKDPAFKFNSAEWLTPNTYNRNFADPPDQSGVYLIALPKLSEDMKYFEYDILYVGSSKNLRVRYAGHEILRFLRNIHDYVQFYFIKAANYKEIEKILIKTIQPRYNKQWR